MFKVWWRGSNEYQTWDNPFMPVSSELLFFFFNFKCFDSKSNYFEAKNFSNDICYEKNEKKSNFVIFLSYKVKPKNWHRTYRGRKCSKL